MSRSSTGQGFAGRIPGLRPLRREETPAAAADRPAQARRVLSALPTLGLVISALLWVGPARFLPVGLALACLLLVWLARTPAADMLRAGGRIAIGGLLVTGFVGLYPSIDLGMSVPRLYGIVLGAAVFGFLLLWLNSERRLTLAGWLFLAVIAAVVAFGLLVTDWPIGWDKGLAPLLDPLYTRLPRLPAGLPFALGNRLHPNKLAAPLAMLVPIAAGLFLFERRRGMGLVWGSAAAVAGGTLFLTQSRSAYLAVGGALLVLLAMRWRPFSLLLLPYVFIMGWILVWGMGPRELVRQWPTPPLAGSGPTTVEVSGGGRLAAQLTLENRRDVWAMAVAMIGDFPFTGVGIGTFPLVAQLLYGSDLIFGEGAELPHAHNVLLQAAVDLGLPGLGFFLLLTVCAATTARRAFAPWVSRRVRGTAAGAACGLIAYYLYGLTDAIGLGEKPGIVFWILLGIVVACAHLADRTPPGLQPAQSAAEARAAG